MIVLQVENWCPRLPWRAKNPNEETDQKTVVRATMSLKRTNMSSNSATVIHAKYPRILCHINAKNIILAYFYLFILAYFYLYIFIILA